MVCYQKKRHFFAGAASITLSTPMPQMATQGKISLVPNNLHQPQITPFPSPDLMQIRQAKIPRLYPFFEYCSMAYPLGIRDQWPSSLR